MATELQVVPITLEEANTYVVEHHRHSGPMPLPCARFACAVVTDNGAVCGVAIAGHTSARALMNRTTLEINRVCTDGASNACSMLYAALLRAGKALGYRRFVTYTLASESGASLRASGWRQVAALAARSWQSDRHDGQSRADRYARGERLRWEIRLSDAPEVRFDSLLVNSSPQLLLFDSGAGLLNDGQHRTMEVP